MFCQQFNATRHRWAAVRAEHVTCAVLDASEIDRRPHGTTFEGLVCHSHAGRHFIVMPYGEWNATIAAIPSSIPAETLAKAPRLDSSKLQ